MSEPKIEDPCIPVGVHGPALDPKRVETFWMHVTNAHRVLQQLIEAKGVIAPEGMMVAALMTARDDIGKAIDAVGEDIKTGAGPANLLADPTEAEAMMFAAMTFGYNELAERAESFGDKVHFRILREECLRSLQKTGSKVWAVTLLTPESTTVIPATAPEGETPAGEGGCA